MSFKKWSKNVSETCEARKRILVKSRSKELLISFLLFLCLSLTDSLWRYNCKPVSTLHRQSLDHSKPWKSFLLGLSSTPLNHLEDFRLLQLCTSCQGAACPHRFSQREWWVELKKMMEWEDHKLWRSPQRVKHRASNANYLHTLITEHANTLAQNTGPWKVGTGY